jgi:mobilization protein NikA
LQFIAILCKKFQFFAIIFNLLQFIAVFPEARCVKWAHEVGPLHECSYSPCGIDEKTLQGCYDGGFTMVMNGHVRRGERLKVNLTSAERAAVEESAAATGRSLSSFLRDVALGFTPKSNLDLQAVEVLVRTNADLGRLGGLLKLWLTERPGQGASPMDVRRLLKEIEDTQVVLRSLIQRI